MKISIYIYIYLSILIPMSNVFILAISTPQPNTALHVTTKLKAKSSAGFRLCHNGVSDL